MGGLQQIVTPNNGFNKCVTMPILVSADTTTTKGFCTRPKGKDSPTSSTSTSWCWSTIHSLTWALQVKIPGSES